MEIIFEEMQIVSDEILDYMTKAANRAVELEELPTDKCEVSVTFVSLDEIHEINREYREVDSPTDVLSFPQYEREDIDFYRENPDEVPDILELGDVVICKEKAEMQSVEFGHSFEREIIYLFTHSILHLLGYDHMEEDEKKVMRTREEEIMDYLNIKRA